MIEINLLQQEGRSKAAAATTEPSVNAGNLLVAVVLLIAFLIVGAVFYVSFAGTSALRSEYNELSSQRARLQNETRTMEREYENLRETLEVLRNQDMILSVLDPEDRLFWAEKLNILPSYMPDGVYLTRIRVTEDVREVETPESRAAYEEWQRAQRRRGATPTDAPQRTMIPVIQQRLVLNGVAYVADGTSAQRLERIIQLYSNLEDMKVELPFSGEEVAFMDNMMPGVSYRPFNQGTMGGREVTEFEFVLQTRPAQPNVSTGSQVGTETTRTTTSRSRS